MSADEGGASAPRPVRVVVIDDQPLVRQGIRALLSLAGVEVLAEAEDGADGVRIIEQYSPDVALMDLRMPGHDGLWALAELRGRASSVPVLVLTTFDDDSLVLAALQGGAKGYLLKDVTVEQLGRAVRALAEGGTLISPSINERLLRAIQNGPPPTGTEDVPAQPLTERELEVLRLVAEGYSNREIATGLFLAEGTVKNHVSTILEKLAARDRTNAVLRALREGLLF